MVLWELLNRCVTGHYQRPYGEYPDIVAGPMLLIKTAKQNLRPTIPAKAPKEFGALVQACWHPKPPERPDAVQILATLTELKQQFETDKERRKEWGLLRHKDAVAGSEESAGDGDTDEDEQEDREGRREEKKKTRTRRAMTWLNSLKEPLSMEDFKELKEFEEYYAKDGMIINMHEESGLEDGEEGELEREGERGSGEHADSSEESGERLEGITFQLEPERRSEEEGLSLPLKPKGLEYWKRRKEDHISRSLEKEKAVRAVHKTHILAPRKAFSSGELKRDTGKKTHDVAKEKAVDKKKDKPSDKNRGKHRHKERKEKEHKHKDKKDGHESDKEKEKDKDKPKARRKRSVMRRLRANSAGHKDQLSPEELSALASEQREICPEGMECTSMDPTHFLLYQHTPTQA